MKRTEVRSTVKRFVENQFPNLNETKKEVVVDNVSKSIRRDFYILDLNLKSEMKRRIKSEVLCGTTNRLHK